LLIERFGESSSRILEKRLGSLALMAGDRSGDDDFLALEEVGIRTAAAGFGRWSWVGFGLCVGFSGRLRRRFRRGFGGSFSLLLRFLGKVS